jgi:hypothetical protein
VASALKSLLCSGKISELGMHTYKERLIFHHLKKTKLLPLNSFTKLAENTLHMSYNWKKLTQSTSGMSYNGNRLTESYFCMSYNQKWLTISTFCMSYNQKRIKGSDCLKEV